MPRLLQPPRSHPEVDLQGWQCVASAAYEFDKMQFYNLKFDILSFGIFRFGNSGFHIRTLYRSQKVLGLQGWETLRQPKFRQRKERHYELAQKVKNLPIYVSLSISVRDQLFLKKWVHMSLGVNFYSTGEHTQVIRKTVGQTKGHHPLEFHPCGKNRP
jgi:hypothetical protein